MWLMLLAAFGADPEPIPCCSSSTVQRNMTYYLRLHKSLALDGDNDWSGVMYGWRPVAKTTRDPSLSSEDRVVLDEIADLIDRVKNGPKKKVRGIFPEISKRMVYLSLQHPGGAIELREAHCPGVGPWLQRSKEIHSPYDGCGVWSER